MFISPKKIQDIWSEFNLMPTWLAAHIAIIFTLRSRFHEVDYSDVFLSNVPLTFPVAH